MNTVIKDIGTDDISQTSPLVCKRSWSEEMQKRREKRTMVVKKNWKWYEQPDKRYQQTGKGNTRWNWRERKEKD